MRYLIGLLAVSLMVLAAACNTTDEPVAADEPSATPTPDGAPVPTEPEEMAWEDVVELMEPSTVMVRADFPETVVSFEGQGSGTGIVYSDDGYIITNAHVVSGAAALTVSTSGDPRQRSARFIGVSACDDLAVLQVTDTDGLGAATLGDSNEHRVGAEVATLGYPLGDMLGIDMSFARGVIGQMNDTQGHYERLIQHDAAVNPGNSGGPLVTRNGEVIGVNSLFIDPAFGQSMYWAIDINQAKPIIDELEDGNNRLWHGMNLVPNTYPDYFGSEEGLVVAAVGSGSSASSVGVQPAYLLTHLEGLSVNTMEDVCRVLRSQNEGDSVSVEFMNVTETHWEFYEGEVVLGGSGGADLELVYSEPFDGEAETETETQESDQEESDQATAGGQLTTGSWEGTAEVALDYWAPCGEDNDWVHYHSETFEFPSTLAIRESAPEESNPYILEFSNNINIDALFSDDAQEGEFWIQSSTMTSSGELREYWILDYDGYEVFGTLAELRTDDEDWGNFIMTYLPVDPCSDEEGFELAELEMDTETYLSGYLDETGGYLEVGGMTADLFRDFLITVELERTE